MFPALFVLVLILYIGIAWAIFKDYRHTRNIGFLIIGCGVLVWPLVGNLLMRMVTQSILNSNGDANLFPFSLISGGRVSEGWIIQISIYIYQAIHAGLILIGFIAIGRSINITYPPTITSQH